MKVLIAAIIAIGISAMAVGAHVAAEGARPRLTLPPALVEEPERRPYRPQVAAIDARRIGVGGRRAVAADAAIDAGMFSLSATFARRAVRTHEPDCGIQRADIWDPTRERFVSRDVRICY